MAAYMGVFEIEMALQERVQMIDAIERSQEDQMAAVEGWLMGMLAVDPFDPVYDAFRSYTTLGLDVASLVSGGYGLIKGIAGFSRLVRVPGQVAGLTRSVSKMETLVNRGTSFAGRKHFPLDYAPYQKIRNKSAIINGRQYTGHSLDRMQDRGFVPSLIENTINTGRVSPAGFPGVLECYDSVNKIRVIIGENGQIITIIPGRG
jgi:hypothetical protein